MQFYRLQYVSILENKAFLADLPSKSFLPCFTGKTKFTGHLPVNRWSGKISQITTLAMNDGNFIQFLGHPIKIKNATQNGDISKLLMY